MASCLPAWRGPQGTLGFFNRLLLSSSSSKPHVTQPQGSHIPASGPHTLHAACSTYTVWYAVSA